MPQLQLNFAHLLEQPEIEFEKRVISWYSTRADGNGKRYIGQDESCLRYLHLPEDLDNVHFNLNCSHSDDDFQLHKYDETENISDLLTWIKDFGNKDNMFAEAEFICHSKQLAAFLSILYEQKDHQSLHVEVFGGKFYIRRIVHEENFLQLAERLDDPKNAFEAMRTKQALKLNGYLISGSPDGKPNPEWPRRCKNGRRIILSSSVGEHKLLYASAFKCIDKADNVENLEQATLTALRSIAGENSSSIYRDKWMEWWSHCILGNVNRTVLAYLPSPENGNVTKLEIVETSDMFYKLQNSRVRRGNDSRCVPQENACFSGLDEILTFIKSSLISASADGDIYELRHDKSKLGLIGLRKIYITSKLEVVPAWFKEWVSSNKPNRQAL